MTDDNPYVRDGETRYIRGVRHWNGHPQVPQTIEELRALCQDLVNNHLGEWHWNSYSGIGATVPKGHLMDDSVTVEEMREWGEEPSAEALSDTGHAWVLHVNQPPMYEGRGDDLHHPLPREVAVFVEKVDPAFVLALIEGREDSELVKALRERDAQLSAQIKQLRDILEEKNRQLGFYPDGRTPLPEE